MPNYELADGTLKNRVGASDPIILHVIEIALVATRLAQIEADKGPPATFDETHLRALHQFLFQDVYEWAGRMRHESVALSDGTIATMPIMMRPGRERFLIGPEIPQALDDLMGDLKQSDFLRGLEREAFTHRAGVVFARLNSIHPFREGNGRTQRAFMGALGAAGWPSSRL